MMESSAESVRQVTDVTCREDKTGVELGAGGLPAQHPSKQLRAALSG